MAVVTDDVVFYQSISADSLGGAIDTIRVPQSLNLYFNEVELEEAQTGSVAYRCFYVQNDNATDTLTAAEIFISVLTPNPNTFCELGLGTAGLNGTEQTVSGENIAPVGVTFDATDTSTPLVIGDLAAGDNFPIWIRRTVEAQAFGQSSDQVIVTVRGDGGL